MFSTVFYHGMRARAALLLCLLGVGCGNPKDRFLEGRVLDPCDQSWPVCSSFAGCLIGNESYITGRFPNSGRFIVTLAEPSDVQFSLFVENVQASGNELVVDWYESACGTRYRTSVPGVQLQQEVGQNGYFSRTTTLNDLGDHLIEFQSDAQADYFVRVDIVPKRLEPSGG